MRLSMHEVYYLRYVCQELSLDRISDVRGQGAEGIRQRSEVRRERSDDPYGFTKVLVFRPIRVLLFDRRHELLSLGYVMSLIH